MEQETGKFLTFGMEGVEKSSLGNRILVTGLNVI